MQHSGNRKSKCLNGLYIIPIEENPTDYVNCLILFISASTDALGARQILASGAFRVSRLPETDHRTDVQSARRPAGVLRVLPEQVLRDVLPVQAADSGGT